MSLSALAACAGPKEASASQSSPRRRQPLGSHWHPLNRGKCAVHSLEECRALPPQPQGAQEADQCGEEPRPGPGGEKGRRPGRPRGWPSPPALQWVPFSSYIQPPDSLGKVRSHKAADWKPETLGWCQAVKEFGVCTLSPGVLNGRGWITPSQTGSLK